MKKFSKINNLKVNNKPQETPENNEEINLKSRLLTLMDRILKPKAYGPVDNRYLAGKVEIDGKKMLADAIIDTIEDLINDEKEVVLENLKNKIYDWETIDNEIENLRKNIPEHQIKKFKQINEKYKDDETLLLVIENKSKNMNKYSTIHNYIKIVEQSDLKDSLKNRLCEILNRRIKEVEKY